MRVLALEILEELAGGIALAVVFVGTIVAPDHFRHKGKDGLDRRVHQGSGKHLMLIGGGATPRVDPFKPLPQASVAWHLVNFEEGLQVLRPRVLLLAAHDIVEQKQGRELEGKDPQAAGEEIGQAVFARLDRYGDGTEILADRLKQAGQRKMPAHRRRRSLDMELLE